VLRQISYRGTTLTSIEGNEGNEIDAVAGERKTRHRSAANSEVASIRRPAWLVAGRALRYRALRPPELHRRLAVGGGLLAGIGFTMALFIANLASVPN
jgi:hypothetical protein